MTVFAIGDGCNVVLGTFWRGTVVLDAVGGDIVVFDASVEAVVAPAVLGTVVALQLHTKHEVSPIPIQIDRLRI